MLCLREPSCAFCLKRECRSRNGQPRPSRSTRTKSLRLRPGLCTVFFSFLHLDVWFHPKTYDHLFVYSTEEYAFLMWCFGCQPVPCSDTSNALDSLSQSCHACCCLAEYVMAHYSECAQASGARRPTKAKLDSDNRSAPPRITDHEQSYIIDKKQIRTTRQITQALPCEFG